ncbi:MAG: PPOX class F420-dependent oxidoreductase [Acidimicrobiales bacterium]
MSTADEKYVALTTFRKNGERKSTAVWIAEVDGELGFTTGTNSWKLKRLRNDPRCELQPCDRRGAPREGAIVVTGQGRQASADEYHQVKRAIEAKYGVVTKLIEIPSKVMRLFGKDQSTSDTAILIALD